MEKVQYLNSSRGSWSQLSPLMAPCLAQSEQWVLTAPLPCPGLPSVAEMIYVDPGPSNLPPAGTGASHLFPAGPRVYQPRTSEQAVLSSLCFLPDASPHCLHSQTAGVRDGTQGVSTVLKKGLEGETLIRN